MKWVKAALFLIGFTLPAQAWTHGAQPLPSPGPILQDVAVNFGSDTPTGRGGVWLNSMDNNQYGVTTSGLDIETTNGTTCATYSISQTGGTAGHFTLIANNTPIGSTAITPVPSAAGQTAHLNGGPYTFSVTCKDAALNNSNSATLTYNIVTKAANMGTNDSNNFNNVQSGFGATAGYQFLISTGFQRPTTRTGVSFSSCLAISGVPNCTIAPADPARPALQVNMELNGSAKNIDVNGLVFTGNLGAANVAGANASIMAVTGTSNIQAHNNIAYFTPELVAGTTNSGWVMARLQGPNPVVDSNTCYYCQSGILLEDGASGAILTNNNIRGWASDCFFIGNTANVTVTDNLCAAPFVAKVGVHVDAFQIASTATPPNLTVKRNFFVGAEGNSITQGPLFNLGLVTGTGYVSAAAGSTSPGKHLTLVTGTFGTNSNGSQIYSPGNILSTDNAIVSNSSTGGTSGDLSLATNVTIGSAASPVPIYSYGLTNMVMDGNIFMSATTNGYDIGYEQGTSSIGHFGYASQIPGAPYATSFIGTITGGTTLTVPLPVNGLVGIENGSHINFAGCPTCSTTTGVTVTRTSGPSNCIGASGTCVLAMSVSETNQGPIAMTSTPAPPWTGVNPAIIKQENTTTAALHGGTFTRSNGWSQSGIVAIPGPSYPANTTDTNVFSGATTTGASAFSNGDPQTQAEAISASTWAAMSNAQLRAQYCHIWLPKVSGPLDLGGGNYAAPVKLVTGQGQWFDGTVIPGCS